MNLDDLVAPLRADVVSGAATIARAAADVLGRAANRAEVGGAEELREMLAELGLRILDAQPAMAPLVHLVAGVLIAVDEVDDLAGARAVARKEAACFRTELEGAGRKVAGLTARLLPDEGRILTISASSTVEGALVEACREGRRLEVLCLESRPLSEGRNLARSLADAGVPVVYAVDGAAWTLAGECAAVVMGADSIGDAGVVNKIGSRALAEAARHVGIPLHVLSDRTKLLPPGFPQPVDDDRPEEEVWRSPAGVDVWNRYFEHVPLHQVERVVLDDGILTPEAVAEARTDLPVPDPLREWARTDAHRRRVPS